MGQIEGVPFRSIIDAPSQSRPGAQLAAWHFASKQSLVRVTQHDDSHVSNVANTEK